MIQLVNNMLDVLPNLDAADSDQRWPRIYWAAAAVVPVTLYLFEALQTSFFTQTQAPNVTLVEQLLIMLAFYGLWIFVPRLSWVVIRKTIDHRQANWGSLILRLTGAGLAKSAAHLFILAVALRFMYSPPGWGPSHLAGSFAEVWLGYGGMWMLVFALVTAFLLFLYLRRRQPMPALTRYEVRHGGKILSLPLSEIFWIKAAGNYVELYTEKGVILDRKTLAQAAKELTSGGFLKSHRSALVNTHHVEAIKPSEESGSFTIFLTGGREAPLSRRNLSQFRALLKTAA